MSAGPKSDRSRSGILVAALLVAALIAGVLIVLSAGPAEDDRSAEEIAALFADIPQDGISLGDPEAPVTMVEFADLQCPFCARYATEALPDLLDDYVRPGKVRMELRLLSFIGPASERAARVGAALTPRDSLWPYADLFFNRQGSENSGYVTDGFLTGILDQIDGIEPQSILGEADRPEAAEVLSEADALASEAGIESTPSFLIGPTGGELERFEPPGFGADDFRDRLDQAIADAG